jgi:hypothetical protein
MASATASRSPPEATIYARVGGVIRIVVPFKVSSNRMTTTWRSLRDDLALSSHFAATGSP